MTTEQAVQYLEERTKELDKRYRDQYFKWSTADLVAVEILLGEVRNCKKPNDPREGFDVEA